MTTLLARPDMADLSSDDYLVVGLATCFLKEDGKVQEIKILEPIPSAALEAIVKGIPTSYQMACATTLETVLSDGKLQLPDPFPSDVQRCDEFDNRAIASARTYKRRPVAQAHIALGTTRLDFKYSLERKRVLNSQRLVSNEDNVKQHEYTHKVL
jgi:hypothetical protein